jgi:thiamine-phosphate pyrophosphorylase
LSRPAFVLRGLYAVTAGPDPVRGVADALAGGGRAVQYRDKGRDPDRRRREALELLALCRERGVPLLINDDVELAAAVGADGVHLGRDDPPLAEARRRLGPDALIGVSCYNELERALAARDAGADYVAFGRFFASGTKPLAVQAEPALLRRARPLVRLPLVAIGGITPENGGALIEAGADMLAVVGGVFGQPDIRRAALAFSTLFEP